MYGVVLLGAVLPGLGIVHYRWTARNWLPVVLGILFFWIAGRNGERRCLVHDKSLSDKALQNFAADMHALGKDKLVNEVRQVQSQVAVLNVSYGDWWLVLPDRRMILWRYESVIGLLGWKKSDFSAQECTDYQANNGGCVGRSSRPM